MFGQYLYGPELNKLDVTHRLVGPANEETCLVEGVSCISLLDTGSMVTTISEPFYREHLGHLRLHPVESLLKVTCANGVSLPYLGYVEVTFEFLPGINVPTEHGVLALVVPETEYHRRVPVVIGTNLVIQCIRPASLVRLALRFQVDGLRLIGCCAPQVPCSIRSLCV